MAEKSNQALRGAPLTNRKKAQRARRQQAKEAVRAERQSVQLPEDVIVGGLSNIVAALRRTVLAVVAVTVLVYALWLVIYLPHTHDIRDFAFIGRNFITSSHASATIKVDPNYLATLNPTGYDGQFYYYIALDPQNAHYYFSQPAYRYTRILYPMAARLLALGQPALIPYTLVLLNMLAIPLGTFAIALWLRRRGLSPWLALLYGLYPGQFVSLWYDLADAPAYALVAGAICVFDGPGRRRLTWSAVLFALAGLTRETCAVIGLVYGLSLVAAGSGSWQERLHRNGARAAAFTAAAVLPLLAYKIFLGLWLRSAGLPLDPASIIHPFYGIFAVSPWYSFDTDLVRSTVVPAVILGCIGLWALVRRYVTREVVALLATIELSVVMVSQFSYDSLLSEARITIGVPLLALVCIPIVDRLRFSLAPWRLWLVVCAVLWFSLMPHWLQVNSIYHTW